MFKNYANVKMSENLWRFVRKLLNDIQAAKQEVNNPFYKKGGNV